MNHPYRSPEAIVPYIGKPWRVVDPDYNSGFQEGIDEPWIVGYYRWHWTAWLAARWYLLSRPMNQVIIQVRKE